MQARAAYHSGGVDVNTLDGEQVLDDRSVPHARCVVERGRSKLHGSNGYASRSTAHSLAPMLPPGISPSPHLILGVYVSPGL